MVDAGMKNGVRPRKFFKSRAEAETYAEQLRIAKRNEGDAVFNLSPKQRVEALEGRQSVENRWRNFAASNRLLFAARIATGRQVAADCGN